MFAGDLLTLGGRIRLSNAVNIRRYREIGIDGAIKNPDDSRVVLKKIVGTVDIPAHAELYRIQVPDDWGKNAK